MAKNISHGSFTKRIALSLTAAVIVLAWGPLLPVRGQCSQQEIAKLVASDAADFDQFGISVSIDADTAIIGAQEDDHVGGLNAGSAYAFVRIGGMWTEQAKLIASDAAASDRFGNAVAVSGNTALVGAQLDDDAGGSSGSVYVFVRSGTVWTQQAKLTASDAAAADRFGIAVAISGDTAVVGAWQDDHAAGSNAGSAYVFVRSGTVWTQQAKLTASDAAGSDQFGVSVALSGDTAVVGTNLDDHAGGTDAGAGYVFIRSGTVWTQQAKLIASDAAAGDEFGYSVAVASDTAVIGSHFDDHSSMTNAGSAYVFVRAGGVWTEQSKLTANDAGAGDWFGESVAVWGDVAVVGAPFDSYLGIGQAGSAYIFVRSGTAWTKRSQMTASDAAAGDQFGVSVALSGDTAVVGAYLDDPPFPDAGSAYMFSVSLCGDDDADGVFNYLDACPNNAPGLPVAPNGRPLRDCNNDCLVDGQDVQCFVAELLGP